MDRGNREELERAKKVRTMKELGFPQADIRDEVERMDRLKQKGERMEEGFEYCPECGCGRRKGSSLTVILGYKCAACDTYYEDSE